MVAASLALWVFFRIDTGICLEDALITYRYAENLALGEGFVFNPGERVLGTTTPLFTLMLAASGLLFGVEHIPLASNLLSAIFGQLAGLLSFAALRRLGFSAAVGASAAALFLFQPDVVVAATGGMETMLVVGLMASSFYALSAHRQGAAVVLCALLVVARIDGILWAAIVLLLVCWEKPASTHRYLLLFFAAVAPWALFAQLYFGSVLPHSMLAKLAIGSAAEPLGELDTLAVHVRWFVGATGIHTSPTARGPDALIVLVAAAILALAGTVFILRKADRPALLAVVLFPPLLCVAYFLGRTPRIFPWYLVPPLWCFCILVVIGAVCAWAAVRDRLGPRRIRRLALGVYLGSLLLTLLLHLTSAGLRELAHQEQLQDYEDEFRRRVGEWLATNTPEGASVATEAIGYQGYYSKRRIIDLAGLTSREVVAASRESRGNSAATFHRVLKRTRPDYLVLRSFEVDRNRAFHGGKLFETREQRAYFDQTYVEMKRFRAPGFAGPLSFLTVFAERNPGVGSRPDGARSHLLGGSPDARGAVEPARCQGAVGESFRERAAAGPVPSADSRRTNPLERTRPASRIQHWYG